MFSDEASSVGVVSTIGLKQKLLSGELYENDHENRVEPYGFDDVDLWDFLCEIQRRMLRRVLLLRRFALLPRRSEVNIG